MGNHQSRGPLPLETVGSVELNEYEKACALDQDVRKFDEHLMLRTERVLRTLAGGVDEAGLSFDSLREVTSSFLDVDQEVVNVILSYKKDIWASDSLFDLVKEYFDTSMATLDFCGEVNRCIKRAKENQLRVQVAINMAKDHDPKDLPCEKILEELDSFVKEGNPFGNEFIEKFQIVYNKQVELQKKLQERKKKLDRKLKFVKAWTKVSTIIFAATCAAILICAVVAAAIAAPPVASIVTSLTSIPIQSAGKWFGSLLYKYQKEIQEKRDLVHEQHRQTFVVIREMDTIKALVNQLHEEINSTVRHIEFGIEHGDPFSLQLVLEHLENKVETFIQDLNELEDHVDRCSKTIRRARTLVLRRIVKKRSKSI